ncbi:Response regulator NasT [Cronobacter sakazakii 701]|nr:Response regulator NasT [Cronobacter sakazakii 701]
MAIPATSLQNAQAWFRFARERKRSQLEAWSGVGDWVSQISHLVHMLQRERGASNIWLCSGGQLSRARLLRDRNRPARGAISRGARAGCHRRQPAFLAHGLCALAA